MFKFLVFGPLLFFYLMARFVFYFMAIYFFYGPFKNGALIEHTKHLWSLPVAIFFEAFLQILNWKLGLLFHPLKTPPNTRGAETQILQIILNVVCLQLLLDVIWK